MSLSRETLRAASIFMNDSRSNSTAGSQEAIAHDAGFSAMPAERIGPQALSHRDKRVIAISMMLPVFLGSVDQSVLASALPTIGRDLGQVHNLPWLVTAFLIASTAFTPLYGKFADIHGRRATMLIGVTIYVVGSLLCAASPNMLTLIGGRAVQGCGAGGLVVTANMVLGDIASPKERGRYYTYFSIAFMTAGGSGPALGGFIAERLHWQMIFLWNLPLSLLAIVVALTVLRLLPQRERRHRLDVAGAILVIAASSAFMLALNLGGLRYPWLSLPILGLLAGALVLGFGLVARLRTAAEPLIPIVTLNSTAGLSSQLLGRMRRYKLLPLCFLFVGVDAVVALALSAESMTTLRFEIILFLIGIGFGPTAPLTQVALQNTVPARDLGAALGTMNFTRTLIATIMIAIFGAIVLAHAPVGAPRGTLSQDFLGSASMATFAIVFLAIAATLLLSFLALVRLEEKPLADR